MTTKRNLDGTNSSLDRELVDRISYLASLASEVEVVDPLLDKLRDVTARWNPNEPLSTHDRSILHKLENDLKHYLIHNDPLRQFTAKTLEARISGKGIAVKAANLGLVMVPLLSLASAGVLFAIAPDSLSFIERVLFGVPIFFVVLHLGIAWFFLSSLSNFNREFRRAIICFSIGLIVLGITLTQYVFIQLFKLDEYAVFRYAGITWLNAVPFILLFFGIRMYAKLLNIKSRLMSLPFVFGIGTACALAMVIVPHPVVVPEEAYFDLFLAGDIFIPLFGLFSALLARKITHTVSPAYAQSMRWLYRYFIIMIIGTLGAHINNFFKGEVYGAVLYTAIALGGAPPQFFLLYIGYLFKKGLDR